MRADRATVAGAECRLCNGCGVITMRGGDTAQLRRSGAGLDIACKGAPNLSRDITRPALSDERVRCNSAGQVELKCRTPWRDGTTHLELSPPMSAHRPWRGGNSRHGDFRASGARPLVLVRTSTVRQANCCASTARPESCPSPATARGRTRTDCRAAQVDPDETFVKPQCGRFSITSP